MADIRFHDISYAQGEYNMDGDSSPIVFMKMSGAYTGSKTPYYDVQAARNYNNAVRLGKVAGLYHFAGGGDPTAEADFFIGACSPLAENDVLILDYELGAADNPPANPVAWCQTFVDRVHERTGVWPLFYTYRAFLTSHDFSGVLRNCGLWVADYTVPPEGTVPCGHPYIIHQYQGSPLDTNACFIDLDTLRKYGYHANQPTPAPAPAPAPSPVPPPAPNPPKPDPQPTPEPTQPIPNPSPQPNPEPTPTPVKDNTEQLNWLVRAVRAILRLFHLRVK